MSSSSAPLILVVVIDRLGAPWLGPYGNSWVGTPTWNEVAAESLLCEFMQSEGYNLAPNYRAYWEGISSFPTASPQANRLLPRALATAGYETLLLTDDADIVSFPGAEAFGDQLLLQASPPSRTARSVEKTRIVDLFDEAAKQIDEVAGPLLLWVHASAMQTAWDAPYELCTRYADDDETPPPELWLPPQKTWSAPPDADELVPFLHTYAGQVAACDAALGRLIEHVRRQRTWENVALLLTSPRGYPLGENGAVGAAGDCLRGEVLQVPLLWKPPSVVQPARLTGVYQPVDVYSTLLALGPEHIRQGIDLLAVAKNEQDAPESALTWYEHERSLRTSAWQYRERMHDGELHHYLYMKPDDRWEVNEVSSRARDVATAAHDYLSGLSQTTSLNTRRLELPELLTTKIV